MSADAIGRRREIEERLARARTLAQSLDDATAELAMISRLPIEDVDPTGSLRTALSALAGVAALRPDFDVIVSLPGASCALRVQHVDDAVEIEVLQRDEAGDQAAHPDVDAVDSSGGHVASDLAAMLWQDVGARPA